MSNNAEARYIQITVKHAEATNSETIVDGTPLNDTARRSSHGTAKRRILQIGEIMHSKGNYAYIHIRQDTKSVCTKHRQQLLKDTLYIRSLHEITKTTGGIIALQISQKY